jgi:signal transduction histidine kinase
MADLMEINFITDLDKWYIFINNHAQTGAYCMYFLFLSRFINLRQRDRGLHKQFLIFIYILVAYVIFDFWMIEFDHFWLQYWMWTWLRAALVILVFYIAWRVARLKQPYAFYPIAGGIIFVSFALLSLLFSINHSWIALWPLPFGYALFYYYIGVVIELIFFSLGLAYKRRRDAIEKTEAQEALKLEIEKQKVKQLHVLSDIQEKERSRVAKDLHDGLGSMLSGIKMSLSNMRGNAVMSEENVQVFGRSLDMLDTSIRELRRVAHNLMPATLLKFGLTAALKDFADFVNQSKTLTVIFQQVGSERRLETQIELGIYRVANELINNALRHASATQLILQLNFEDHSAMLTVEDNGKGFDPGIAQESTGSGWTNIRSRVDFLKGSLDIQTAPGKGTTVTVIIPL